MAMPPYERAASIRAQLDRLFGDPMNPMAPPQASHSAAQPAAESSPIAAPKRRKNRPRSTAFTDAKNILRAATAFTSNSLATPQFIHRSPDFARHRRKCAVCHHPEREAIEDLFIHWHSPEAIASFYDDGGEELNEKAITWISIYRHAYAFGLDEIRRRNLRFVFEHILDQAGTTAATPSSIIVAARALASCVNENGSWNEPPKRVIVTNIVRNEPPQPTERISGGQSLPAQAGFSSDNDNEDEFSSDRALHPRDVLPQTGEGDVPASASPALVGADSLHRPAQSGIGDNSSFRARPEPARRGGRSPRALDTSDVAISQPTSAERTSAGQSLPAQAGFSSDDKANNDRSSFRASHPRDIVPASSPEIRNSLNSFNSKEPQISNR